MNKYVKFSLIGVLVIVALAAIVDVTNLIFSEEPVAEAGPVARFVEATEEEKGPIELHFNDNGRAQWTGDITNETTYFTVNLKKGQTVQVVADTMYSWNLLSPTGQEIGCSGDMNYCIADQTTSGTQEGPVSRYIDSDDNQEVSVATAPSDGTYQIETTYRVCGLESGCSPINDTIIFIVR